MKVIPPKVVVTMFPKVRTHSWSRGCGESRWKYSKLVYISGFGATPGFKPSCVNLNKVHQSASSAVKWETMIPIVRVDEVMYVKCLVFVYR